MQSSKRLRFKSIKCQGVGWPVKPCVDANGEYGVGARAGLGGLTTALALNQAGFKVRTSSLDTDSSSSVIIAGDSAGTGPVAARIIRWPRDSPVSECDQSCSQSGSRGSRCKGRHADQGIPQAQFNMGVCYSTGKGVAQDYKEAVRWYRKAADQGYADAQFNLGLLNREDVVF